MSNIALAAICVILQVLILLISIHALKVIGVDAMLLEICLSFVTIYLTREYWYEEH